MSHLESAKKAVEKVTGVARPGKTELAGLVRQRKANAFLFKDDGLVPNHPAWPLVVYRGAVPARRIRSRRRNGSVVRSKWQGR